MSVKLLTEHHLEVLSLKGGCTDSSESTLVKMPHGWKSHEVALIILSRLRITIRVSNSLDPDQTQYNTGSKLFAKATSDKKSSLAKIKVRKQCRS